MPRIVASGSRQSAFEDFCHAAGERERGLPILLVDAEAPVAGEDPWDHLHAHDGWARPSGTDADRCHLMVAVMESWFLADGDALAEFFGNGFRVSALPANPQIEEIPKDQVLTGFARASRHASKGTYSKSGHSFRILARLDPRKVQDAAPFARRFFSALRNLL
jgi:hypothetical protein